MDTTSTTGRGIDVDDLNQALEVEQLLHSMIYRTMDRDRKAHDGSLTEVWQKLYDVLAQVAEVGTALSKVKVLILNPPKAEEAEKGAGLGNMTEAESALYNALTQEGD